MADTRNQEFIEKINIIESIVWNIEMIRPATSSPNDSSGVAKTSQGMYLAKHTRLEQLGLNNQLIESIKTTYIHIHSPTTLSTQIAEITEKDLSTIDDPYLARLFQLPIKKLEEIQTSVKKSFFMLNTLQQICGKILNIPNMNKKREEKIKSYVSSIESGLNEQLVDKKLLQLLEKQKELENNDMGELPLTSTTVTSAQLTLPFDLITNYFEQQAQSFAKKLIPLNEQSLDFPLSECLHLQEIWHGICQYIFIAKSESKHIAIPSDALQESQQYLAWLKGLPYISEAAYSQLCRLVDKVKDWRDQSLVFQAKLLTPVPENTDNNDILYSLATGSFAEYIVPQDELNKTYLKTVNTCQLRVTNYQLKMLTEETLQNVQERFERRGKEIEKFIQRIDDKVSKNFKLKKSNRSSNSSDHSPSSEDTSLMSKIPFALKLSNKGKVSPEKKSADELENVTTVTSVTQMYSNNAAQTLFTPAVPPENKNIPPKSPKDGKKPPTQ